MIVMACSGHQFGLCRWFTYQTIFLPTLGYPILLPSICCILWSQNPPVRCHSSIPQQWSDGGNILVSSRWHSLNSWYVWLLKKAVTPVTHQSCTSVSDLMLTPVTHQPCTSASDPMQVQPHYNRYVQVDRTGRDQEWATNRTEQFAL